MNTRHVNSDVYMGRSDKRTKKYMVVIGTKTVHFGTRGQLDYTKTHDVNAKQAYIAKHPGLSSATNKQMLNKPIFWERWILYNKPSKRESIRYLEHKLHIRIRPLPVRLSRHRQVVVGGGTSRRSRRNTQKTAAAVITAAALATALAIKHNQKHAPVAAPVVQTERAAPVAPVIEAEAARVEAERVEAERVEAERVEAERVEAQEAVRVEAERVEAEQAAAQEAARVEAAQEAEREEAERAAAQEAERVEAERAAQEAARVEAQEAVRVEAERAVRVEAERAARVEAARVEAERAAAQEAERIEAEAERAAAQEAERVEAERVEAERVEAERVEAQEAVRVEAERAVRVEAAQQLEETAHHEQQIINVVNNAREQYKQIHKAYDNANTELGKHSMCIDSTRRNLQYAQLLPSYSTTERYISAQKGLKAAKTAYNISLKAVNILKKPLEQAWKTQYDAYTAERIAGKLKQKNMNTTCMETIKSQISSENYTTLWHARCFPMFNDAKVHISSVIGSGDYGSVWDVQGLEQGKIVIKEQKGFCYTFINEIKCLEKLNDTGIIPKIYDAYICIHTEVDEQITYGYVMDKLDMTLFNFLIIQQPMSELQRVGTQIHNCLTILDQKMILHRDFNLNNIMLKRLPDKTNRVYIIDFGVAYDKTNPSSVTNFGFPLDETSQLSFYHTNVEHAQNYFWFKKQTMTAFTAVKTQSQFIYNNFTAVFRIVCLLQGDETTTT